MTMAILLECMLVEDVGILLGQDLSLVARRAFFAQAIEDYSLSSV